MAQNTTLIVDHVAVAAAGSLDLFDDPVESFGSGVVDIVHERGAFSDWVKPIVAHLDGRAPSIDLPLDIKATAFQWKVWRYLQSIPYGETRAYSEVAKAIGEPQAIRAVARACATNHVCVVIPCHRVVQKDGGLGGYRWGVERKRRLLQ